MGFDLSAIQSCFMSLFLITAKQSGRRARSGPGLRLPWRISDIQFKLVHQTISQGCCSTLRWPRLAWCGWWCSWALFSLPGWRWRWCSAESQSVLWVVCACWSTWLSQRWTRRAWCGWAGSTSGHHTLFCCGTLRLLGGYEKSNKTWVV